MHRKFYFKNYSIYYYYYYNQSFRAFIETFNNFIYIICELFIQTFFRYLEITNFANGQIFDLTWNSSAYSSISLRAQLNFLSIWIFQFFPRFYFLYTNVLLFFNRFFLILHLKLVNFHFYYYSIHHRYIL